jgi:hypothetical protein
MSTPNYVKDGNPSVQMNILTMKLLSSMMANIRE